MTRTLTLTAVLAALAVPAAADVNKAVDIFNQSLETGEQVVLFDTGDFVTVSTRNAAQADVVAIVNASADSQDGKILGDLTRATGSHSARAQAIFDALAEADDDN